MSQATATPSGDGTTQTIPDGWAAEPHPHFCHGVGCGGSHVSNSVEVDLGDGEQAPQVYASAMLTADGQRRVGLVIETVDALDDSNAYVVIEMTPGQVAAFRSALGDVAELVGEPLRMRPRTDAEIAAWLAEIRDGADRQ